MVHDAAGGSHDDMHAPLELPELNFVALSAIDGQNMKSLHM